MTTGICVSFTCIRARETALYSYNARLYQQTTENIPTHDISVACTKFDAVLVSINLSYNPNLDFSVQKTSMFCKNLPWTKFWQYNNVASFKKKYLKLCRHAKLLIYSKIISYLFKINNRT